MIERRRGPRKLPGFRLRERVLERQSSAFPLWVRNRPTQQRTHFFLDVDNDLGFAQLLGQVVVCTLQLLVLFGKRTSLGLRSTLPRLEPLPNAGISFAPPLDQDRGVQTFAAQQRTD